MRASHPELKLKHELFMHRMGDPNIRGFKAPCRICKSPCDGTMMRTHPCHYRVKFMLTEPEVPRHPSGYGILLCHQCQRSVAFAGSLNQYLLQLVKRTACFPAPSPKADTP